MARLSVRCHEVVIEAGHVEVAARGPFAGGGVPDAGADEHERAPAVGEAARHAGATPDLAVEPFDHVVLFFPPIFFLWGRWKTAVFAGRSRWWSDLWCNDGATRAAIWFGKVFASRNLVAGGG